MTQEQMKRQVGYYAPLFVDACGICRRCHRDAHGHLSCSKWGFQVSSQGICRNGYEKHDEPLNVIDHPLLVSQTNEVSND